MVIDLESFERELPIDIVIPAKEIDLENENVRLLGALKFGGNVVKGSASTIVVGHLSGISEIGCDRCLEPIERELNIQFEDEFILNDSFVPDKERELRPADLAANEFDGTRIDLAEVAREQILLDVPQQVFCKADCKGLCVKCGTDLNLLDCNCSDSEIDPRWAALRDLN